MKFIKTLVTLAVLIAVVGVGIVIAAPKYPQAQMLVEKLHLAVLQPVADETLASAAQIQTKLPQLGTVLGVKTEQIKNSKEASLPQKTMEYARYAYCQQVVQDYEARNGINSSASASPRPPRVPESPRPTGSPLLRPTTTNKK